MNDNMQTLRAALDNLGNAIADGQPVFDLGRHFQNCINRFMEAQSSGGVERPWQLEAIKLIGQDKRVAAIKYCREHTGLELKEAKDLCDELHNEFFIYTNKTLPDRCLGDLLRDKLANHKED